MTRGTRGSQSGPSRGLPLAEPRTLTDGAARNGEGSVPAAVSAPW